jgi:hypothetical protein
MSVEKLMIDSVMNQIILGTHESNIITAEDIQQALLFHPLFNSIVDEMDNKSDLATKYTDTKQIKQITKEYKKYYFTEDALMILQNFINFFNEQFQSRKALVKRFPLLSNYIDQIYLQPSKDRSKTQPELKQAEIDFSKPLFHTTNAFEVFEMKNVGTPYGPAWFNIDSVYSPDRIQDFHRDRGGVRVIQYKWIPGSDKDFTIDYPFIDVKTTHKPKILDARKLKLIPAGPIEKHFEMNGMVLELPKLDKEQNILMSYGKTWRPFIVKYLEDKGYQGILTKKDEIVIFRPERWIKFENIEQGDLLYSALIESLNKKNKNKIEQIASKYKIDDTSLKILYNKNFENIPK